MENADVGRIFSEMADIYEIQGENPFKVRALRTAARTLERTALNVLTMAKTGGAKRLKGIDGIGDGLARRIVEIARTGELKEHQDLIEAVPETLLTLLEIPGLGPKTVKMLFEERDIRTVEELEAAARGGRIRGLPRMGKKSEDRILEAIERHRAFSGRFLISQAERFLERLLAIVREVNGVERAEAAGSFRRRRETIGDLDVLCLSSDPMPVIERFAKEGDLIARGDTKCSVRLPEGINADLRVVPADSFGAAMHYFTGSKDHNVQVRLMANQRGLTINEYGVFRLGDDGKAGERIGGATEEEVFASVGLPWIPPELRENAGELEAARSGTLPTLIEQADLKGDLHMHTKATDGGNTVREMAEAAIERGHRYIAITDHSKALAMTGGLDEARLKKQGEEIREVERALGGRIRILRGIEVDILEDGSLDLADDALAELDVVVGSVHSHFEMDKATMTRRVVRAIESGRVDIIGHPTGRMLRRREPYPIDMDEVCQRAKAMGVALEVSSAPHRLDLGDAHCRLAHDSGVRLVINTDAHHAGSLAHQRFGLGTARRGWLEKADVLNTIEDADALLEALHGGHR